MNYLDHCRAGLEEQLAHLDVARGKITRAIAALDDDTTSKKANSKTSDTATISISIVRATCREVLRIEGGKLSKRDLVDLAQDELKKTHGFDLRKLRTPLKEALSSDEFVISDDGMVRFANSAEEAPNPIVDNSAAATPHG